ncbi:HU family DNA-binding protein [Dyadobacter sp. CY312]|uniref:HU family DNA-binding protein n=1 Tax=Dyadobacter sp. CY312 TaxID=2907303 RepID=UPI001F28D698|nr:HU family DNA-binding protein [Dyadobacter sp. CY312]MCE7039283.1 HU family DNA-binding protein [Dyadobacter sp. CY312]
MRNTKSDIVDKMLEKDLVGMDKPKITKVVNTLLEVLKGELVAGNSVTFKHFGCFKPLYKKANEGANFHNPGTRVIIPGRYRVSFTAADSFHEKVNIGNRELE